MSPQPKIVMGIDQSLRHTGICWIGNGLLGYSQIDTLKLRGVKRLQFIRNKILEQVNIIKPNLVCMEGYSYASPGRIAELGELGGVIKLTLADVNVPVIIAAPMQMKKYVTGSGHAEKADVVAAINSRLGLTLVMKDNNIADAFGLATVGKAFLEEGLPKIRHEAEVIHALRINNTN